MITRGRFLIGFGLGLWLILGCPCRSSAEDPVRAIFLPPQIGLLHPTSSGMPDDKMSGKGAASPGRAVWEKSLFIDNQDKNGNGEEKNDKETKAKKPAKTLLEWLVGPETEEDDDEVEVEEPLATDRPDFTEASSNVGRGRVQLETGYTYFRDRATGFHSHSLPEALLRVGMFADWFELRIAQNFAAEQWLDPSLVDGRGATDLYLGIGLALTEQKGIFPESRVVFQTLVPSGHRSLSAGQMLPGVNLLYGWDIIEDKWTAGASSQMNRAVDDSGHHYVSFAQSLTTSIAFTSKLRMYTEWFVIFPSGAIDPEVGPEHYFDGGFTYLFTNNFQWDIRAGTGLNARALDFFAGSGLSFRY